MKPLTSVDLGEKSYPVYVERDVLSRIGQVCDWHLDDASSITLLTSPVIDRLYGEKILAAIKSDKKILIPEGEEAKTWENAGDIIGKLIEIGVDRKGIIVSLGGGSVGDVAGFVSSIYLRGIGIIQVPTTLLSMVDSSIGGKTAVNHPKGKNLIGSFHQPVAVLIDPNLLSSLPVSEIRAGLGEVIKYGVIADEVILDILEREQEMEIFNDLDLLSELIGCCISIKSRYVEKDEFDLLGIRASLNYGHTLGHAIEKLKNIRHGEAVSIGMDFAARIAVKRGIFDEEEHLRQRQITKNLGLPYRVPGIPIEDLLDFMRQDKKTIAGKIRFVLPTGIGKEPILEYITENEIKRELEELK
jgi:3-dehydroquinate synthase